MFITAFTSPIPVSSSPSFWLDVCAKPRITSSRPKFTRPIRRARMIVLDDMGTKSESSSNQPVPIPTPHDLATGRDPARIKIFDTTLRDGEQSPGVSLTTDEKLVIARQLSKLGVDIIEAGFPIASDGDFEAVKSIAINIGNSEDPPIICGLARALKKDIIRCYDAIKYAAFPRIHTFVATSELHMVHKLRKSREEVLHIITDTVAYASSLCDDIEFSAEDAARSDPDFLCEAFSRAIEAGATTINIPDTVGYTTPQEFGTLVQYVRNNVRGIEKATVSVHGHNDLGMAVANFFSALENGARQLEVTINGIGERAGNASLEEIVMGLHVRRPYYNRFLGRDEQSDICLTNICRSEIHQTSRMVSNMTGMVVQPNKAIVGANAFSHESGIHQDGVLKHRQTYEIMDAQSIGLSKNSIVLGKHSGRHAFRTHLKDIGYELSDEEVDRAFRRFKSLADKKKEVSDADIESLVNDEMRLVEEMVKLGRVQVQCGDHCIPTATVTLVHVEENREETMSSVGTGPVDAVFNAIQKVTGSMVDMTLKEYKVSSVTKGIDALGEVSVKVVDGCTGKDYIGASANTDVVVASAQAYVNVINRCHMNKTAPPKVHPQFGSI